ncbi:ATP-dependent Clp protease ATP-binding subunit [Bacillus canaveralius]|uniref:ATP-dependent Clp protease ATP-binding subunit n=1 Tax=Bacillus canaveralius TaxID=1403243 RepID=A0A2N5GQQ8_9BACI|nr:MULTISPECIES: ATP-dependent Clp protease ATP-binding subunit [Bacillus]PLR85142.1 ATP-dependent Clp protease ATP-binding subunit [Bacillus sp. V33-4]PLR85388.1 ATP-dependent Clp protease ATP-binding subunit [Bacillus canaveralius]PLR94977.1 ATP-dependent Clp protease ATP-binding subunit [Bacillus canaveralius]RSK48161.1 ATP-dependent Clp protease ATP-binding subunit [Bacillus canaveralius]
MYCERCNENHATIKLSMNLNGQYHELKLCSTCYKEERNKLGAAMGGMNFGNDPFEGFSHSSKPFDKVKQPEAGRKQQSGGGGLIGQYGRNLTDAAKAGLVDPVIGRDKEVSRVIEILNRRNKNNPVLIGEPGVGKTAIAEGLASKIAEGSVPAKLRNKVVYMLDVASLVSNTGIRGQFEERMKQLISELQERKNVILFIDEIHQIVGAGSAEGSMDAGNILKPALARGELQLVGATTLSEYRKIEKDGALERRFQPVQVDEPTTEEALAILHGLKESYETYHEVTYSDEALKAAVELSHRYIQDRFLPDKAIDLMDEAGSKLNLTIEGGNEDHVRERLAQIHQEKEEALNEEAYEKAAALRDEEANLEKLLQTGLNTERLIVSVEDIQSIIEEKTGIPVGKLQEDEQIRMVHLQEGISKKVIGQEEAVKKVSKAIRRSRAGLKSKNRPIGSFLFVGPTGVGKTELSKALAEELFGDKESMIRLDMSEFMEKHSVSKLIGSPPGYVGHEEAGQLTEKVRRNPYSIILMDEIEKAHPDVMHMFLQILDDGRLTDSQGRTVSFKNAVIIMTSNAGVGEKRNVMGFGASSAIEEASILQSLGGFFKPEFLNRFDSIIEFSALKKEDLLQIVDIMLKDLDQTLASQGLTLEVSTEAKEKLVALGYNPAFGARPLRRVIQEQLEDAIADFIFEQPEVKDFKAVVESDQIKIIAVSAI